MSRIEFSVVGVPPGAPTLAGIVAHEDVHHAHSPGSIDLDAGLERPAY